MLREHPSSRAGGVRTASAQFGREPSGRYRKLRGVACGARASAQTTGEEVRRIYLYKWGRVAPVGPGGTIRADGARGPGGTRTGSAAQRYVTGRTREGV